MNTLKKQILSVSAIIGLCCSLGAQIITTGAFEDFTSSFDRQSGGVFTFTRDGTGVAGFNHIDDTGFDATTFDKLVVAFSGENLEGLQSGGAAGSTGVTYGGAAMTIAVGVSTGGTTSTPLPSGGQHWAYVAYLDDPTVNGDLVFDFTAGNANGVGGYIFGLNNTADGVGVTALNGGGNSVSLTTSSADSFILGVGTNNDSASGPSPDSPLTLIGRIDSGSSGHGSGYQQVATASTSVTPTLSGANVVVGAEFTAVPEPSAFALLAGCFGLTWVMLRRRG